MAFSRGSVGGHASAGSFGARAAVGGNPAVMNRGAMGMNRGALAMNHGNWGRGDWDHGHRRGWGWGGYGLGFGLGGLYAYGGPDVYAYCDPYDPYAYDYGYCGSYTYTW
jgi:hypothetical protein